MRFLKATQGQYKSHTSLFLLLFLSGTCEVATGNDLVSTQQETSSFSQIISDKLHFISNYFSANDSAKNNKQTFATSKLVTSKSTINRRVEPEEIIETTELSSNEFTDIWPRIREGFQLPTDTGRDVETNLQNKILQEELNWYANNPDYIQRVLERAEPFLYYILEETKKRNLPTELVLLPIVESAFRPFAYSHGRAAGLWQFIPSTGRAYGLKQNWWYDGRRDIYSSTQAALKYLTRLHRTFDGDWLLALAAYNSGQGTVKRAIRKNKKRNLPTDFWSLKLPDETVRYVPRLLALKKVISYPENYNIDLHFIADQPGFEVVKTKAQIDLALAAELAEVELETLYMYNPGFNRWATDPDGPHQLLLPISSAALFEANYDALPADEHIKWQRHKIKKNESLGRIASKYHTSVAHLKKANKMRSNNIKEGDFILIPASNKQQNLYTLSSTERLKSVIDRKQPNKTRIEHTVKYGESFWSIAKKYNVKRRELAKWNGLAIKDPLKTGQKLVIWDKNQSDKNAVTNENHFSDTITSIHYTVRSGDSLSRIASKYQISVRDIHRWNTIKGKYLKPGQRLKLYIDVTEQSNQS